MHVCVFQHVRQTGSTWHPPLYLKERQGWCAAVPAPCRSNQLHAHPRGCRSWLTLNPKPLNPEAHLVRLAPHEHRPGCAVAPVHQALWRGCGRLRNRHARRVVAAAARAAAAQRGDLVGRYVPVCGSKRQAKQRVPWRDSTGPGSPTGRGPMPPLGSCPHCCRLPGRSKRSEAPSVRSHCAT